MAVEAGGFTGIIEADEADVDYLVQQRGLDADEVRKGFRYSDPDAEYAATFEIDLDEIRPMVATPGDPRNGIPLDDSQDDVRIDAAYGGSCTGGKKADMDMYAAVLAERARPREARRRRRASLHPVRLAEDQAVRARAGLHRDLRARRRGADRSVVRRVHQRRSGRFAVRETVTVSAHNRNFPGRSGPGKVYLASPYVVAASAIAGKIVEPHEFLRP